MPKVLRALPLLIFLIPLPLLAQRFCWLDFVDVSYHSLLGFTSGCSSSSLRTDSYW